MNLSMINPSQRRTRAFTLVEILTAVAITTIIVFALVSMFNTSIKALQTANRQTDIWEAARSTFGILKNDIGEVTTGDVANRVNLFAANNASAVVSVVYDSGPPERKVDLRLQDVYLLSRENNQWNVNVYLLGKDRQSDPDDVGVKTLYLFRANYSALSNVVTDIDQLPPDPPSLVPDPPIVVAKAVDALNAYLDDVAKGINTNRTVSVMAKGIVHLSLVPYATDGRAYTNWAKLSQAQKDAEVGRINVTSDSIDFRGDAIPSSVDLEMFVLEPDRIAEYKSQGGLIARRNYLDKHINSVQLFRTRIPVRRELLARQ